MIDVPTFNPLFYRQSAFILQTTMRNQGLLMTYKDALHNHQPPYPPVVPVNPYLSNPLLSPL